MKIIDGIEIYTAAEFAEKFNINPEEEMANLYFYNALEEMDAVLVMNFYGETAEEEMVEFANEMNVKVVVVETR